MTFFWQNPVLNPHKSKRVSLGYSLVNDEGWISMQLVSENDYGCVSTVRWRSSLRVTNFVSEDKLPIQLHQINATTHGDKTRWSVHLDWPHPRKSDLETPKQGRIVSRVVDDNPNETVRARRTRILEQMVEHEGRTIRKFDLGKGRPTKWIVGAFQRWAELVIRKGTGTPEEEAFWEKLYDEADHAVVNQLYKDLAVDREWGRVDPGDVVVFRKGKKVLAVAGRVPRVNWCEPLPDYVWAT